MAPVRIAMWSGPRSLSTAMMRAWENRADTAVIDEPFYAHYLVTTGAPHPGREEVIAAQDPDWRNVASVLCGPVPDGRAVWYQKHMVQHFTPDMEIGWLGELSNVFLIRDPIEVVASFARRREVPALWELGFETQVRLFDYVADNEGEAPPVLDARDVLDSPESMLRKLCERVGVAFSERMLRWPPGPRASDGIWARYWYDAVYKSTGFTPYRPREECLPDPLRRLADAGLPHYQALRRYRTNPDTAAQSPSQDF